MIGVPPTPVLGFVVAGIVFSWLSILSGSLIAIVAVGYPVAKAVARYLMAEARYV
ncbi:MAG: hypothetical protein QXQ70_09000 [Candidatus Caldarchaeum sp.]